MYTPPPPVGVPNPALNLRARLRPMGIGDILDETFRLYRANFALFVATEFVSAINFCVLPARPPQISPRDMDGSIISTMRSFAATRVDPAGRCLIT